MTRQELEMVCQANGVPYRMIGDRMQVMDMTVIGADIRAVLDEQGFYMEAEAVEEGIESSQDEMVEGMEPEADDEPVEETADPEPEAPAPKKKPSRKKGGK